MKRSGLLSRSRDEALDRQVFIIIIVFIFRKSKGVNQRSKYVTHVTTWASFCFRFPQKVNQALDKRILKAGK